MQRSRLASAVLIFAAASLLGCPHVIHGIPTAMTDTPRFRGPLPLQEGARYVPVTLDFETEGHFLVYHLRVDERNLEPTSGSCRRWFLHRVAREAETAERSFCANDSVRFFVVAGVPHTLELLIGSEHTVVKRVLLRPGENPRWRMPITTQRVELPIDLEPGYSYTIRADEEDLNLRNALRQDAPSGTRWDLDGHEPVFHRGVELGAMRFTVVRDRGGEVINELSVPLYSGRMSCKPPFCAAE